MTRKDATTEGYIYPKEFFQKNSPADTKGLCFVIMPFEEKISEVYDEVISKTLLESGLTSVRADKVFDTKPIMISIMQKINEAELVIADVTGRNPNVFYELGMAHTLKDKVILIAQDLADVPFDLRHFRFILYSPTPEGKAALRQSLVDTCTAIGIVGAPIGGVPSAKRAPSSVTAGESGVPEPLSIIIYFDTDEDWRHLKGRFFAQLTRWVEFEEVEDKQFALNFPGGTIKGMPGMPTVTLRPGSVPVEEFVRYLGIRYRRVQFKLARKFDLGDLVRRSRNGVRSVVSVSKESMLFSLRDEAHAQLTLENTGEGSTIAISPTGDEHLFSAEKTLVPYAAVFASVLGYLEKDPPTGQLEEYLSKLISDKDLPLLV